MITIKTKRLSLLYSPVEDRMKLFINKGEKDQIDFWITRRFYFSLLFELDTMLENLEITPLPVMAKKEEKHKAKEHGKSKKEIIPDALSANKSLKEEKLSKTGSKIEEMLLENVNIRFSKKKKVFIFLFQSGKTEAKSVLSQEQFLNFHDILKRTFPKREWGMM
jgi:hypothetical protein